MSKVRINDLARELEVKSKEILDALTAVGVTEKKTHSSSIEDDEADKVRGYLTRGARSAGGGARPASQENRPGFNLSHVSKPGDALKAILERKQAEAAARSTPPPRPASSTPSAGSRPAVTVAPASSRPAANAVPPASATAPARPGPMPGQVVRTGVVVQPNLNRPPVAVVPLANRPAPPVVFGQREGHRGQHGELEARRARRQVPTVERVGRH